MNKPKRKYTRRILPSHLSSKEQKWIKEFRAESERLRKEQERYDNAVASMLKKT